MKVAIQGEPGSFHDEAAHRFFSDINVELVSCQTFQQVFDAVENDSAKAGLVAVENSLYGSIHDVYDELATLKASIIGEITLAIEQQLIAHLKTKLNDITEVYSHPAALNQCRDWLETNLPNAELIEHHDTAGAVNYIKSNRLMRAAAIASEAAAHLYDMSILRRSIQDEADNFTRFLVITHLPEAVKRANKASLILVTSHEPGALYEALGVFKRYNCNLTKLESRPIRGKPFNYQFIVDVLTDQNMLISTITELERQGCRVTMLGHYEAS